MNGDTETYVVSGFRRDEEAQAYARAENKRIAQADSCSHCDIEGARFCPEHDVAHWAIHERVEDGKAIPYPVVVFKRG